MLNVSGVCAGNKVEMLSNRALYLSALWPLKIYQGTDCLCISILSLQNRLSRLILLICRKRIKTVPRLDCSSENGCTGNKEVGGAVK